MPSANRSLVFSYLGFVTQNVTVGSRTVIDMVLNENLQEVDEVVVIGYGAVKKNDLTGSVANVKMADIENVPVISVDQALRGVLPVLTSCPPPENRAPRLRFVSVEHDPFQPATNR